MSNHDVSLNAGAPKGATGNGIIIGKKVIQDLPTAIQDELASLWEGWASGMIEMHERWHSSNGSGGTEGPGSGQDFLLFHEKLEVDFVKIVDEQGSAALKRALTVAGTIRLPKMDFGRELPPAFQDDSYGKQSIDLQRPDFLHTRAQNTKNKKAGDTTAETFTLDGEKVIRSLNDIADLDDLGRVIGESGFHGFGHIELGGVMGSFASVSKAAFMLWHGWVVEVTQDWLGTPNGKRWLDTRPVPADDASEGPATRSHADMMHSMDDTLEADADQAAEKASAAEERATAAEDKADEADDAARVAEDNGDPEAEALRAEADSLRAQADLLRAAADFLAESSQALRQQADGEVPASHAMHRGSDQLEGSEEPSSVDQAFTEALTAQHERAKTFMPEE